MQATADEPRCARRLKSCGPDARSWRQSGRELLPTGGGNPQQGCGDVASSAGESTKQAGAPPRAERRMQTA